MDVILQAEATMPDQSRQVLDFITEHFDDPNLSIDLIRSEFHISYLRLSRILKEDAGMGLIDFVHGLRLAEAKRLLTTTDNNIDVIAEQVGYLTARTLNRAFLRYEKTTPREYRKQSRLTYRCAINSRLTG